MFYTKSLQPSYVAYVVFKTECYRFELQCLFQTHTSVLLLQMVWYSKTTCVRTDSTSTGRTALMLQNIAQKLTRVLNDDNITLDTNFGHPVWNVYLFIALVRNCMDTQTF